MATEADLHAVGASWHAVEIAQLRSLLRATFSQAPNGLAVVNTTGRVVIANAAMCSILGLPPETVVGLGMEEFIVGRDRPTCREAHQRLLGGDVSVTVEVQLNRSHASPFWARVTVTRADPALGLLLYQVEDVQERREAQERLEHAVDHDLLTGVFNRGRFDQELRREVERHHRHNTGGAVLMLDLDGFKAINDQFGHGAGDELLHGIAARLQARCRAGDSLARLGGDEFALLVPGVTGSAARRVAEALVELVASHVLEIGDERPFVTASVGVALFDGVDNDELLAFADAAMYAAKNSGGNRFVVYDPHAEPSLRSQRVAEASQLRQALHRDGFVMFCQPIRSLRTGDISQYELLVRMRGDDPAELLQPNAFLGAAERLGIVAAIDAWVVAQAVRIVAANAAAGRRLVLNVNLSGRSLGDQTLADRIAATILEGGVDPSCLVFEITETAAIADLDTACAFAERLRELGCRLALDDFGAGFASFYYLKRLPFDFIKIDGVFVQGLPANATDRLVVAAIVDVARGMGKQTVAEYVTDQETLELLDAAGVDFVQGFHVGVPEPADEVLG